jgi:hypothetical protein
MESSTCHDLMKKQWPFRSQSVQRCSQNSQHDSPASPLLYSITVTRSFMVLQAAFAASTVASTTCRLHASTRIVT